jgi:hypothetical protein
MHPASRHHTFKSIITHSRASLDAFLLRLHLVIAHLRASHIQEHHHTFKDLLDALLLLLHLVMVRLEEVFGFRDDVH